MLDHSCYRSNEDELSGPVSAKFPFVVEIRADSPYSVVYRHGESRVVPTEWVTNVDLYHLVSTVFNTSTVVPS